MAPVSSEKKLAEPKADKEKTEADKEKTEADKEKTEADKEKTKADKEKTEADKEKTEADKEKTEADKEKTEADKEKTKADKEKTEADKDKEKTEDKEKKDNTDSEGSSVEDPGENDHDAGEIGSTVPGQHDDNGDSGLTLEQLTERLIPKSHVEPVGPAFCLHPPKDGLPLGYETRVTAIQHHPKMQKVEKTDYIKEVRYEPKRVSWPKTGVRMEKVKHKDQIIVVRRVPKTRIKTVCRVVQEQVEVTEMEDEVEYIDVVRIEEEPYYYTDPGERLERVPVLREKPVTTTVDVPTEGYCDTPIEHIFNGSLFNFAGPTTLTPSYPTKKPIEGSKDSDVNNSARAAADKKTSTTEPPNGP